MTSKIQSILIDTHKFTLRKAYDWVVNNGFKHSKIDVKAKYYRFRQFNPKSKKQYRTINLTDGVKAILEF
jgi:hypothetical protein